MIDTEQFGSLPDGRPVTLYRITNTCGEFVELLDYGAAVNSLFVRDKAGVPGPVTLGAPTAAALAERNYAGVTIGRCANRIANGQFQLDGRTVQLECGRGGHYLHGGSGNYANRFFSADADGGNAVVFSLLDAGGGGFGSRVQASVRYAFGDDHQLSIHYTMTPEADTLLNPTNHSYFNLAGSGDILHHSLQVYAHRYARKGPLHMPQGERVSVAGTPLDFRKAHCLGDVITTANADFFGGTPPKLDETLLLENHHGFGLAAELYAPESGRWMCVYTDMPALVLFTPWQAQPVPGPHHTVYAGYCGIALETQFVPNAINCPGFAQPLFRAGRPLRSETIYAFGTEE